MSDSEITPRTNHITVPGSTSPGPNTELMRSTRPVLTSFSLTLVAAVLAACTTATDPEPIASISMVPQFDSVELGQTYNRWVVTLKDAAGNDLSGRALAWESNNPAVATIDASTGILTAVGSGQTLVTVRAEGQNAAGTIKVLQPVLSIVAVPDSFDLPLTTTRTIPVQLIGPGGVALTNRAVIWSSLNPSVAVVSTTGLVTAISAGTTTITIAAGQLTKDVRVRVVAEPVTSVRILPQQSVHVIRLGQVRQLTAECLNAALQVLAGRPITWNSGNPVVATVSQTGLVTAAALGSAPITATCDNTVSAQVTAQVTPVPVSSVSISPPGLSLVQGTQAQLQVTARDSANNVLSLQGRQVLWSSNNLPVASVSTQGVVQGVSSGIAQVTVSVDGVSSAPVTIDVMAFLSLERGATSDETATSHPGLRHLRGAQGITARRER